MAAGYLEFLCPSPHLPSNRRLPAPEGGRRDMTLFYSHEDQFRDPTGASRSARPFWQMFAKSLRRFARRAFGRTGAALKIMHRAMVAARMRRIERELMFQNGGYDRWFCEPDAQQSHSGKDAVKFPQRPLILGDKWDF
jgi:hypothetical protein